jgi:hypothetical protein
MEGYATHYTPAQVDALTKVVESEMSNLGLLPRREPLTGLDPEFEEQNSFMVRGSWLAFEFYAGVGSQSDTMGLLDITFNRWLVDEGETDFAEVERAFQRLALDQGAKQKGTA